MRTMVKVGTDLYMYAENVFDVFQFELNREGVVEICAYDAVKYPCIFKYMKGVYRREWAPFLPPDFAAGTKRKIVEKYDEKFDNEINKVQDALAEAIKTGHTK